MADDATPAPMEDALTLYEVAKRLNLSYSTVFAQREQIGFRLPGSRLWRVWPSRLAELSAPRNNLTRLSLRVGKEDECQSAKMKKPASTKLTFARQAVKELDALLTQPIEKRRRSTTIA